MNNILFRSATIALAGLTATLTLGVPAHAVAGKGDVATPQAATVAAVSPGSAIGRAEILARAQTWVSAQVPYSMDAYYGGYRTDCSGFVSMALRTNGSYWTGNLGEIGTPIAFTALQPGDFLNFHNPADPNSGSHVVLFDKWVGAVGGDFWIYEQVKPYTKHRKWSETSGRVLSNYKPMRYVNVQGGTASGLAAGDVTGDGLADVIGRHPDGNLLHYPNSGAAAPYSASSLVGSGWQSFTTIRIADVTGDDKGDLIGVRNDGTLWLYPHGGDNSAPYSNGQLVGDGWGSFRSVSVADVTGDGKADILGVASDGKLLLYSHGGDNSAPYSIGRQVGDGWAGFLHVTADDVTGDGKADIIAAGTDGQLRLYAHTGDNDAPYSTGPAVGAGWAQFDRVLAADTNGDHHADLLATRPDGTFWLYLNTGDNSHPYDSGAQIGTGWNSFA